MTIEDILKEARELLSKPNSVNWNYFCDKNMPQILDELEKLQQQNQIMREALEFYADEKTYLEIDADWLVKIDHDAGSKAQEAVKKVSEV